MTEPKTNAVALKAGGQISSIIPQSFEDAYRVAKCISESGAARANGHAGAGDRRNHDRP
ncbi:MAG: hypothetical protein IPL32_18820 [Chloracidobacterium sp.]|nr:hypothetical protein [Chloracidobacterium sp.]